MMKNSIRYVVILWALVLSGCGWLVGSSSNPAGGVDFKVQFGAPLSNATVTVLDDTGAQVGSGVTDANGAISIVLALSPNYSGNLVATASGTALDNAVHYWTHFAASDIGPNGEAVIINPLSTVVLALASGSNSADFDPAQVAALSSQAVTAAADQLVQVLAPFLEAKGVNLPSGRKLLVNEGFQADGTGLDAVMDVLSAKAEGGKITLEPKTQAAKETLKQVLNNSSGAVEINLATAATDAQKWSQLLNAEAVKTALKTQVADDNLPLVVLSQKGSWGSAGDAWAGYNGAITLINRSNRNLSQWELSFDATGLKMDSFWNAVAGQGHQPASGHYVLTNPGTWGQSLQASQAHGIGFNGKGMFDAVVVGQVTGCVISFIDASVSSTERQKTACKVTYDGFSSELSVKETDQATAYLKLTASTAKAEAQATALAQQVNKSAPTETETSAKASASASASGAQVALVSENAWGGGFSGFLEVANSGGAVKLSLNLPTGLDLGSSCWGSGQCQLSRSGSRISLSTQPWSGTSFSGDKVRLAFSASGNLPASADANADCKLSYGTGAEQTCSLVYRGGGSASVVAGSSTSGGSSTSNGSSSGSTTGSTTGSAVTTTPASSSAAAAQGVDSNRRVMVGYYPSWSDNWFSATKWDGTALSDAELIKLSRLATTPTTVSHVVLSFAYPDLAYTTGQSDWTSTGLGFNAKPADIARAIQLLQSKGQKVLLALGGATYNGRWEKLAAEAGRSYGNATPIKQALVALITDLGLDGLDVDYEEEGTDSTITYRYYNAIVAMREAVDEAQKNSKNSGRKLLLSLAGWSTGADCTNQTKADASCSGKTSYWGGSAGRERLVLGTGVSASKPAALYLDLVGIMSYDARFEHYDPLVAYQAYADVLAASGSKAVLAIGLETAPEGWAGALLVNQQADATCTGSYLLANQYGSSAPDGKTYGSAGASGASYSVERFAQYLLQQTTRPHDGLMLWSLHKPTSGSCGAAKVASPNSAIQKAAEVLSWPVDRSVSVD